MRVLFGCLAFAWVVGAAARPAPAADALPASVSSYTSSERAALDLTGFKPHLSFDPSADAAAGGGEPPTAQQSYLPLLYSLLIPGLGEATMGYWGRGITLMAVEVGAWSGWYVKHNDGLDERAAYEAYADKYWDFDRWIENHPASCAQHTTLEQLEQCGQALSGSGGWPGYIPYVSKEQDKQHYYENIGKYDWYISGWRDWDPTQDPYAHQTDLRTEYRSMRESSNRSLDQANEFVWVSVVARTFSVVETAIIVHNRRGASGGASEPAPVALRASPRGWDGGEVALEVRFK